MVDVTNKPNLSILLPLIGHQVGRVQNSLLPDPVRPVPRVNRLRGEGSGNRRNREDLTAAKQDHQPTVNFLV